MSKIKKADFDDYFIRSVKTEAQDILYIHYDKDGYVFKEGEIGACVFKKDMASGFITELEKMNYPPVEMIQVKNVLNN